MAINFNELSDEELCAECDTPEAFAVLSSRYLGLINARASAFRVSCSLDDDDLRQVALIGLYNAAVTYKSELGVPFPAYAGVCVTNRLKNEVRNHSSRKNLPLNSSISLDDISEAEAGISDNPEKVVENRESVTSVLNQIHISLSDFEKKVLALYLSGYKRSQIAQMLDITTRQFDNALQRVRAKLKAHSIL
ncbi:MAG: sigma-70 family RNA polymerase sigma factor [Clostridia bacterium]|nr:sigma-70 family RNA polymerase sigma factor [Clostridia bacterium]